MRGLCREDWGDGLWVVSVVVMWGQLCVGLCLMYKCMGLCFYRVCWWGWYLYVVAYGYVVVSSGYVDRMIVCVGGK